MVQAQLKQKIQTPRLTISDQSKGTGLTFIGKARKINKILKPSYYHIGSLKDEDEKVMKKY